MPSNSLVHTPKAPLTSQPLAPERGPVPAPIFERLALMEDSIPRPPGLQMALDQALLETTDIPVLRVYRWETACVTIGYFESFATATSAYPRLPVIRRWTGGGLVRHGEDAPYSLIVPQGEPFAGVRAASAYGVLHGALAKALCGRFPEIVLAKESAPKRSADCFENPVPDDLLWGGHKIGGAGQRRTRFGLLHQGSLDLKGAHFEEALPFARMLAVCVEQRSLSTETLHLAGRLCEERYDLVAWNTDKPKR